MKRYLLIFLVCLNAFCLPTVVWGNASNSISLEDAATPHSVDTDTTEPQSTPSTVEQHPALPPEFDHLLHEGDKESDTFQAKFIRMLVLLGLLIGFMLLASSMLKRMMRKRLNNQNVGSSIKILETRYLSPKSTVYLLDIRGKGYIIAEAHSNVTLLTTVPLEEEEH
jgi:flagellar protein FliO/FliZ